MSNYLEGLYVSSQFDNYCTEKGYCQIDSVDITSRIDKTVFLTNSATNLFKLHFGEQKSFYVRQKSMRTQILKDYYNPFTETEYPSYFVSFGTFTPIEKFQELIDDMIEFHVKIGFDISKMRLRISERETFLTKYAYASRLREKIVKDSRDYKYDHTYGMNIYGRAIKLDYYQDSIKRYKNLGYFLLIKKNNDILGCEYASSDQLILMRLKEIKYGIAVSNIADVLETNNFTQRRFADSVVGCSHLLYEGIRPNSSDTNGRTLKKYIAAMTYFGKELGIETGLLFSIIRQYLKIEARQESNRLDYIRKILNKEYEK